MKIIYIINKIVAKEQVIFLQAIDLVQDVEEKEKEF